MLSRESETFKLPDSLNIKTLIAYVKAVFLFCLNQFLAEQEIGHLFCEEIASFFGEMDGVEFIGKILSTLGQNLVHVQKRYIVFLCFLFHKLRNALALLHENIQPSVEVGFIRYCKLSFQIFELVSLTEENQFESIHFT